MKNYDDLQRFKEKTQTLDIAFKDMSGQSQDADQSQWAIIRQLAADDTAELGGQRIDLPQPQPIEADAFVAPVSAAPAMASQPVSSVRGTLLDSLAATAPVAEPSAAVSSLFPAAPQPQTSPSAVTPLAPKATHVKRQATTSLFPPPPEKMHKAFEEIEVAPTPVVAPLVSASTPVVAPATSAQPATSRFGALFRSRAVEPANLSKETPLKPLLEKIALCR